MTAGDGPIVLQGGPYDRGRQQAERVPASVPLVRSRVESRAASNRLLLSVGGSENLLAEQLSHSEACCPEACAELKGLADGFGLSYDLLFALLHLQILQDREGAMASEPPSDGCTVWARVDPLHGITVAKNRDTDPVEATLQRVFLHVDPAWNGRSVVAVGSLGCPTMYSSGMNSDGLAIADTAIGTHDHGVGRHKIFLMGQIAGRCTTISAALRLIEEQPNAGGGSLVLGDENSIAVVELGHRATESRLHGEGWIARTNHFILPRTRPMCRMDPALPWTRSSEARLRTITSALAAARDVSDDRAIELLWSTGEQPGEHLCRDGRNGDACTISSVVYGVRSRTMTFVDDPAGTSVRRTIVF